MKPSQNVNLNVTVVLLMSMNVPMVAMISDKVATALIVLHQQVCVVIQMVVVL
jgi:hypothetical protein